MATVDVQWVCVRLDPSIDIFNVTVSSSSGTWNHTAGSEQELGQFLEGLRAAVGCLGGHLPMPEIPRSPSSTIFPAAEAG